MFDENRYFDVFVEYAKASAEDILMRIERGESRAGGGGIARAADGLVPQYLELGHRTIARPELHAASDNAIELERAAVREALAV